MGLSLDVYICDITGTAAGSTDQMSVVEVYRIGTQTPEMNDMVTALTIVDEKLPDTAGDDFRVYVDDDYNVVSFADESGTWQPTDETFASEVSEAVAHIQSDDYERESQLRSVTINGCDITTDLRN